MIGRALPALMLAVLFTTAAGPVRAQQTDELVLIELQMGRLMSRTVEAVRHGNDILLPLGEFYDLAEIGFSFPRAGTVEARLTGAQGSGILTSMAAADGLMVVPREPGGAAAGGRLPTIVLGGAPLRESPGY